MKSPAIYYANPRRNYVPGSPEDIEVVPKADYDALKELYVNALERIRQGFDLTKNRPVGEGDAAIFSIINEHAKPHAK